MEKRTIALKTVLGTVIAALGFSVPAAAADDEPAVEREIVKLDPLYFVENGKTVTDESKNQGLWNELMKYKLWGTDSVVFAKPEFSIREPSGYTGSAKGAITFKTEKHALGGPILPGGNLRFVEGSASNDLFIKSLVRADSLILPDWYSPSNTKLGGIFCFQHQVFMSPNGNGRATDWVNRFIANVHNAGGKVYADWDKTINGATGISGLNLDGPYSACPEEVPQPDRHLSVPLLANESTLPWDGAIRLLSSNEGEVGYVHVPPITKEDVANQHTWYDKFVADIEFDHSTGKKLYILMPSKAQNANNKTGRLTRIFSRDGFNFHSAANDTKIRVVYVNEDATWNVKTNSWDNLDLDSATIVVDSLYAGNLMFYTTKNVSWEAMVNIDYQGTFMTTGNFTIKDHMNLAGQLIAGKTLWFESDVNGEFHYVPFNTPEIKTDVFFKDMFKESEEWYDMNFYLTDTAHTEVSFDYCFDFFDNIPGADTKYAQYKNAKKEFATTKDLDLADTKYKMPLCSKGEKEHVVINKGQRKPANPSHIKVKLDDEVEGFEYIVFRITNLNGAVISGNKFDGGLIVKLVDVSNNPPDFVDVDDVKLVVPENQKKAVAGTISAKDVDGDGVSYSIIGGTVEELFEIDAKTGVVSMRDGIKAFNYEAWREKGIRYTLQVQACDEKGELLSSLQLCSDRYFALTIADVNEKPFFTYSADEAKVLTIAENSTISLDQPRYMDLDSFNVDGTLTNNSFSAVAGDTNVFDVTSKGLIKTKPGVTLDYETKDTYEITLRVHDVDTEKFPLLYDEMTFTIKVTDVDDGPKFDLDTYNGNINENSVATTKVNMNDAIYASSTQVGAVITYSLIGTAKYTIDPSTGVITVAKDAVLDFETKSVDTLKVVASDKNGVPGQKVQYDTATVIIKLNDVNENPIFVEPTKTLEFPENKKGYEIGTLTFDDLDTAKKFRDNRFSCAECEELGFDLDEKTGTLTTTRRFDYETDKKSYDLTISISDAGDSKLVTKGTITVKLLNVSEFTELVYTVPETDTVGTRFKKALEVDKVEGPDTKLKFFILDGTKEVSSTKEFKLDSATGYFSVLSPLDYETTESYSIRVRAKDANGSTSDTTITVKVIDMNEAPSILVDTVYVKEDQKVNDPFGTVKTDKDDPDTKNADFRNNIYENTDKNEVFKVDANGDVILLKPIDYEADSLYTLMVRVTDKNDSKLTSEKKVIVKVVDVYEQSEVEITRAETRDSVYLYPDSVFTNSPTIGLEWTEDGKTNYSTDSLENGCNVIVKTFKDPTKNAPGADTVVVCYSTAAPIVTITANSGNVEAENIYTVVESTTSGDSAIYVNGTKNDVKVTVKDTAANLSKSFTVQLDLDTLSLPSKEFKNVTNLAAAEITRKEKPESGITSTSENGDYVKNTYTETVNGIDVAVTYYTDGKGKDVKRSVVTSSGKTEEIAVIQISYTTKIDGKDVTVSYFANASTGERVSLNTGLHNSESVLSADGDEVSGAYEVSYNYVDKNGNSVEVTYFLDEKGKIVKNSDGDIAYNVGYTYVNKYGNSSKKEVLIVLDQKGPVVKIVSPFEDAVLTSNFTEVKWTVNGVEQDTLRVQGLENGVQTIIRVFRDKAGNESRDSVHVMVKKAKNIDITVEKPVTLVDRDSVEKYYKSNPPKTDERFSVSFFNNATKAENEVLVGIKGDVKKGSGDEPYPGFGGSHLGPTLVVDARVPVVNALGGLATLDDIVSNGGMIALEGVDAANSEKISVDEYVEKYCTDEFKNSMSSDYSRVNLYWTTLSVKIWVFTNTGSFIDHYSYDYDLSDPDYVSEAGLLKQFFELKPDENGDVRNEDGRLYGTGAYLFKTEVKISSKLRCTLPPISDDRADLKKNAVIKSSDELLTSFGYRRPVNK